jgi:hypothetical protein
MSAVRSREEQTRANNQMNSPPDPGSPSPSTPSSGSPPPDEIQYTQQHAGASTGAASQLSHITSQISSFIGGGPSKRRLPGGSSYGPASNTRDSKSRRREDPRRAGSGNGWGEGTEVKRDKDELVDIAVVERLKKGESIVPRMGCVADGLCRDR